MPPNVSLSCDFKGKALVLIVKSFQIYQMYIWRYRTVNEILLINVDIHISDSPSDLLCVDFANLLPVVWILSIEKHNVRLTWAIIQITFGSESATVNSRVGHIVLLVQSCRNQIVEDLRRWLAQFRRRRHYEIGLSLVEKSIKECTISTLLSDGLLLRYGWVNLIGIRRNLVHLGYLFFYFFLINLHLVFAINIVENWWGFAHLGLHHLHDILIFKTFIWIGLEIPIRIICSGNALLLDWPLPRVSWT